MQCHEHNIILNVLVSLLYKIHPNPIFNIHWFSHFICTQNSRSAVVIAAVTSISISTTFHRIKWAEKRAKKMLHFWSNDERVRKQYARIVKFDYIETWNLPHTHTYTDTCLIRVHRIHGKSSVACVPFTVQCAHKKFRFFLLNSSFRCHVCFWSCSSFYKLIWNNDENHWMKKKIVTICYCSFFICVQIVNEKQKERISNWNDCLNCVNCPRDFWHLSQSLIVHPHWFPSASLQVKNTFCA